MDKFEEISVCYVARFNSSKNFNRDLERTKKFIKSYNTHDAGIPHTLCLLIKGKYALAAVVKIDRIIAQEIYLIVVEDEGFDLKAYTYFNQFFASRYAFLINSHSIITSRNWLQIYFEAFNQVNVAAVGTTASYSSIADGHSLVSDRTYTDLRAVLRWAFALYRKIRFHKYFPKYPNPHVRTNAILVESSIWLEYFKNLNIKTKFDCHRAESGCKSFYNFVKQNYGDFVIVDKNGCVRREANWRFNGAFRTEKQNDYLLISDNQTRSFFKARTSQKKRLQLESWRNLC